MKKNSVTRKLLVVSAGVIISLALMGCVNPFLPTEQGTTGKVTSGGIGMGEYDGDTISQGEGLTPGGEKLFRDPLVDDGLTEFDRDRLDPGDRGGRIPMPPPVIMPPPPETE